MSNAIGELIQENDPDHDLDWMPPKMWKELERRERLKTSKYSLCGSLTNMLIDEMQRSPHLIRKGQMSWANLPGPEDDIRRHSKGKENSLAMVSKPHNMILKLNQSNLPFWWWQRTQWQWRTERWRKTIKMHSHQFQSCQVMVHENVPYPCCQIHQWMVRSSR